MKEQIKQLEKCLREPTSLEQRTTLFKNACLYSIERELDAQGFTKEDLADKLGVNIETLLDCFRLNVEPSSKMLVEMAALLGGRFEVRFKKDKT